MQVTEHVQAAMFFDDDVLLLANPFKLFDPFAFDFRHQTERGAGCDARPNGGLLYVRATSAGKALLREMVAKKDIIESTGDKLDQDYVIEAAEAAGVARCALPRSHFAGHCPAAHHSAAPLSGIATYHAHCCGERDAKLALLERVATAFRKTPGARFGDVDHAPLPGHTVADGKCYYPHWSDLVALRRAWAKLGDKTVLRPG